MKYWLLLIGLLLLFLCVLTPAVSRQLVSGISNIDGKFGKSLISTKLVYVTATHLGRERVYTLWYSDADGQNQAAIYVSKEPLMSPSWSPDGTLIVYASLQAGGRQQLYILDWASGETKQVKLDVRGLFGAPAWSPDGRQLAFTISRDGNADIYILNMQNDTLKRLTHHQAIDTESVWSPDGNSIIFTSDRSGSPQLYEIPPKGGPVTRLTFKGHENTQASISPDGKHIAMVYSNQGKYQIALMERQTGSIRLLTEGEQDESPSFSPNGTMIIYAASSQGKSSLEVVSIDGQVKQRLATYDDVREPAWSPLI